MDPFSMAIGNLKQSEKPAAAPVPAATSAAMEDRDKQLAKHLGVSQARAARGFRAAKGSTNAGTAAADKHVPMRGRGTQIVNLVTNAPNQPVALEWLCKKIPDASRSAIKQAAHKEAKAGRLVAERMGRTVVYSTPGKAAKTPAAPKASPKPKKSHQRAVSARNEPPSATLPQAEGFRCGVMSDGSLRLEGIVVADDKSVSINKGQASVMVAYLRQLEMLGEPA